MVVDASTSRLVRRVVVVGALLMVAACSKPKPSPDIPLLEPGLWTFEIETRREGQPVETRTIRDCVGLRGLYSADRPMACWRNEAVRSQDGRQLTLSLACEIEPQRAEEALPTVSRGRGLLDFVEPGLKVGSRTVFTGDLRKNYVRDNTTSLEWPPGETTVTRSITRAVWRAPTCPVDLPPDRLERWMRVPEVAGDAGTATSAVRQPALGETASRFDRALAPKMRKGLWSTRVRERGDGGTETVHTEQVCVTDDSSDDDLVLPRPLDLRYIDLCEGVGEITAEKTVRGFTTRTRCALPERHLMTADLDFVRPALGIVSRSDYSGDFAARFSVAHDTVVTHASGRTSRTVATNELERLGDCVLKKEGVR
jgi:hypothetical protein